MIINTVPNYIYISAEFYPINIYNYNNIIFNYSIYNSPKIIWAYIYIHTSRFFLKLFLYI